jgi:hypothetical protein
LKKEKRKKERRKEGREEGRKDGRKGEERRRNEEKEGLRKEREKENERERETKRKGKFPVGYTVFKTQHTATKHCFLQKQCEAHSAGRTIELSHVTVLMRCHLFPSKSCCNMIAPLG